MERHIGRNKTYDTIYVEGGFSCIAQIYALAKAGDDSYLNVSRSRKTETMYSDSMYAIFAAVATALIQHTEAQAQTSSSTIVYHYQQRWDLRNPYTSIDCAHNIFGLFCNFTTAVIKSLQSIQYSTSRSVAKLLVHQGPRAATTTYSFIFSHHQPSLHTQLCSYISRS